MSVQRSFIMAARPFPAVRAGLVLAPGAAFRRAASTSSSTSTTQQAADKAKDVNEAAKEKVDSGIDTAKSYADTAAKKSSAMLNTVGEKAQGMLGSYSAPIVYNLAVLREVGKQVYISEKLSPPTNPQVIREAFEDTYRKASDGSWWRSIMESGEWKRVLIYAVEAYGIFTIGEMIGRRHVVGYKIEH